ncbi:ubiquitin carboxyl-terminal hydrolase isozyme L3-like protein [Glomus cerebriforme]|uniref:Ubiquitin carboxyl-terminal hydrolase n=1 Tax=Glomus cerebriforme TaxID=658196 RepID=A0A397TRL9_9GLOM|nr:ubiquitin carboxyl-terminal hydrolase isozyme L3-like protein [Glomus cerebriforme]
MSTSKKSKWLPLESNPQVMSNYVHKLGVSQAWAYTDVWGKCLDNELLSMIPQPVKAVVFLFPITENYERDNKKDLEQIQEKKQTVSPNVVFFRQTIPNACGTIGLLHSLANNTDDISIEDGPLRKLLDKTKNLTPDERAKVLEEDEELAEAHKTYASSGQTSTPRADEDVNLHFTTFIEKDGSLYELDGRKPFPINHGTCGNLLQDSAEIIKKFMKRDPDNHQFIVIALAPNQQ